jgi:hypothetical protein
MVKTGFSALLSAFLRGVAEDRAFFSWLFRGEFVVIDGRNVVPGSHIFGR